MGRLVLTDAQQGFAGGLNTTADEAHLKPNEMRRSENGKLTEEGAVTRRLGTQRTHATALGSPSIVRGGFSWERAASTVQLAVSNGTLYTGTYGIPMTWTSQAGALSTTTYPTFAHFRDGTGEVVYIADGGLLNKWDGTTLTVDIASTPSAAFIWAYNQRLFGVTGTDQTLYWSTLNNGDSLGITGSGGGSAVVRTFGAQALTGGLALGEVNALFHRTGVSVFTGWTQDDISIATGTRGLSQETGTIAPRSIVATENEGYFLAANGVYRISMGGIDPISPPIDSVLRDLDQSLFSRVDATHDRALRAVLFYFPDTGIYAYHYRLGAWSGPWTGTYTSKVVHALWSARDASQKPIVLWGGNDGFVRRAEMTGKHKDDILSDGTGGSTYALAAQCHRLFFRRPTREKALRRIWVTGAPRGSTRAGISWSTTNASGSGTLPADGGAVWGSFTWGSFTWGGAGTDTYPLHAHGRGRYVDITINDDGEAESVYARVEAQAFDMSDRA